MPVATSPVTGGQQQNKSAKKNSYARVIGSACAGVSELLLFHPVDTVAKRLMSNQTVAVKGQPPAEAMAALNKARLWRGICAGSLVILAGQRGYGVVLYISYNSSVSAG